MLVTLQPAIQGMHFPKEGSSVGVSSLKATWPNKMDVKAVIPWSSLAKLFDNLWICPDFLFFPESLLGVSVFLGIFISSRFPELLAYNCSSVQFGSSAMSKSLQPHGLQHTRFPCHYQLLGLAQTHVHWVGDALVMPSNHLILCHPFLFLPSIFPSIRVFSNESVLHIRWSKCWSFSLRVSPSNEDSGLISFRMNWLGLLAAQGTLKNLHQHHTSKATIL